MWSKKSGDDLKSIVTARYSSSTVFLSLLFSTEMAVIYSPSQPANDIREAMANERINSVEYWAGIAVCTSIFFSVSALVANFTAWSVFSSLSRQNAPIVLRSNVGLYAAQLPMRLVLAATYLFLSFVGLTWWVVMPSLAAFILTVGGALLIFHIVTTFSAIGRVVMLTGAMAEVPIIPEEEEINLSPPELSDVLVQRARLARRMNVDVMKQYRVDYQELIRDVEEGKVQFPITDSEFDLRTSRMMTMRRTQNASRFILSSSLNDNPHHPPRRSVITGSIEEASDEDFSNSNSSG